LDSTANATSREDLLGRARERAEGASVPETWGTLLELEEDGGSFVGRYLGDAVDERWDPPRRVFLFTDEEGEACYMPSRYRLEQEIGRVEPGATVAIYRGEDYTTKDGRSGHSYGVETASGEAGSSADDSDIPF
jgi:hypothetical protein